jgi:alpha-glucoside transport system substrate-binding protein
VLYGAIPRVSLKSLVWYPVEAFERAGYEVPETWEELVALTDRIVADGRTPWCLGLESGEASGWPATDWVEDLLLADAGPEFYDRWTFHDVPFRDRRVRQAFVRFGEVVFEPGNVIGGPRGALAGNFFAAYEPMLEDPPGCWLYHFPSFLGSPVHADGIDVFPFPVPRSGHDDVLLGAGDVVVALSDRPEVRELMRFILSPEFGSDWFSSGEGGVFGESSLRPGEVPPILARPGSDPGGRARRRYVPFRRLGSDAPTDRQRPLLGGDDAVRSGGAVEPR